jgi:hypothetical protein
VFEGVEHRRLREGISLDEDVDGELGLDVFRVDVLYDFHCRQYE